MSQNIIIGYPNRSDGATLSGGSWSASLPLDNLKTQYITQVARSTDDANASTKLLIDMGAEKTIKVFGLINHNLSSAAMWKIKVGSTSGGSDYYDSGWIHAWLMTFDSDLLEWESPSWWTGIADDEYLGHPYAAMHVMPDYQTARYYTIEIDDTTNPDGYVQIGRLFCGSAFQPGYNAKYGLQDGWVDLSTNQRAESGASFPTARRRYRTVEFGLDYLTENEAATLSELQRKVGIIGEVLYIPYPENMADSQRYGFLGRLRELSPMAYPWFKVRSLPFKIEEII